MKTKVSSFLALAALLLTSLTNARADDTPAATAVNSFAVDIYPHLAKTKGNLLFSPYCAETALAMTWAGARGQTAAQMTKVLHLSDDRETWHENFAAMREKMNGGDDKIALSLANSLWCQKDMPFRGAFLRTGKNKYGAQLGQVDFENAPEAAAQEINDWAAKATSGKIENALPANAVDKSTRLVLASAAYFKAPWLYPFDKSKTKNGPFHLANGKTADVPMMDMEGPLIYGEFKTYQVVELPYLSRKLSMIVILPKQKDGLADLEQGLSQGQMTQILSWVKPQEVHVVLPKFKFDSEFGLAGALQELGMNDAFAAGIASFSGIAEGDLFISAVRQKAYVDVNEDGTEAAAVAAARLTILAGEEPPPQAMLVRADHPFLFVIRHNETGAILFLGRVARP